MARKKIIFIVGLLLIQGCATAPRQPVRVEVKNDLKRKPDAEVAVLATPEFKRTTRPLQLYISAAKTRYTAGELITLRYRVENTDNTSIYIFKYMNGHYLLSMKGPLGEVLKYEKELIKGGYLRREEILELNPGNFYGGELEPFSIEESGRYKISVRAVGCKNLSDELSPLNIWSDTLEISSNPIGLIISSSRKNAGNEEEKQGELPESTGD